MLFSSITFLYYFLPILLILYFITPSKYKNVILLIASLFFYFYGEPKYIIILLTSCISNYIFSILIDKYRNKSKLLLILSLIFNIGLLFYFKYCNFFIDNINTIFNTNINIYKISLPLGISFFTFQAISYVVDVYKEEVKVSKNFINFATYICLFPQLVAGPIVRYTTINDELENRDHSYNKFAVGVRRFTIGLGKKVLIANVLGELAKTLGSIAVKSVLSFWIEIIAVTLQIYYDFSGYSDMAIGIGKMFGFTFLENFNYPFIAKSITEFWRRWHISLSSWLRDYVYIPLGGNKVSKLKWIRNILVVWFLTGLWHGALWNFIIWGLYFAVFLLLEKFFLKDYLEKHKIFSYIYTFIVIIISFVIFNETSVEDILLFIKGMFNMKGIPLINKEIIYYLRSYLIIIIISIIGATPLIKNLCNKYYKVLKYIEPVVYIIIILVVTAYLIDSSFNPFLYFRF